MKKKSIIAIVSLIVFGQGAWADGTPTKHFSGTINSGQQNEQNGLEGKPYHISSIEDLNHLAEDVNSGTYYKDVHFKLTANLDYSEVSLFDSDNDGNADSNFIPIGSCEDDTRLEVGSFQGTFDGDCDNNYTISGIRVYQPTGTYIGLFGNSYGATIKNIRLSDCQFTGQAIVGGIVAAENSGTPNDIVNCHVDNTVEVTAIGKGENGGFVGGIAGTYQYATISNCSSSAIVAGSQYVGGIVGLLTINPSVGGNANGCSSNGVMVGRVCIDEDSNEYIALVDDANNSDESGVISTYNNEPEENVILLGRTLYRDGKWNTICLPFKVVDGDTSDGLTFTGTPFEGAIVKKLDIDGWYGEDDKCYTKDGGYYIDANNEVFSGDISTLKQTGIEGNCLYLNFATAESIEAGKPYLIKWASGDHITDPEFTNDPKFEGVTIDANASTEVRFTGGGKFVGTYNAKRFTTADLGQYLIMGGDNTLYYTKAGAGIGACRAYFQVPEGSASIKMFNLNFSDYSTTTKITNTNLTNQTYEDGEWWTLSGMKLNGKPSEKGVYLFNGKKVVIQ